MFRKDASAHLASDRASLYDDITCKIIAELEAGRFPWPCGSSRHTFDCPATGTNAPNAASFRRSSGRRDRARDRAGHVQNRRTGPQRMANFFSAVCRQGADPRCPNYDRGWLSQTASASPRFLGVDGSPGGRFRYPPTSPSIPTLALRHRDLRPPPIIGGPTEDHERPIHATRPRRFAAALSAHQGSG